MQPRVILNKKHLHLTVNRLCYQLIENHDDFSDTVFIGLQPRGVFLLNRIKEQTENILGTSNFTSGNLDITFYRDDFRRREEPLEPQTTEIDFLIENKKVVLVDDVLYTGRTIRAALEALINYGRPLSVELLVLINRRYSRDLPIQPDYVGKTVDTVDKESVKVEWTEIDKTDRVILFTSEE